ncbi:MAG: hypothetical protein PHS98_02995 [Bacilli bacterium]|nr:hypothetical protein [Bacilli bacterium]
MRKLLFLFPIEEYMQLLWGYKPQIYDLLNETINERYRQKGYQIVFLTFKKKPTFGITVLNTDKVIEGDITFEEHTTPIGKDENGKDIYRYTSNEYLESLLGEFEELVVCGFHAQDCVMRVAEYFYSLNNATVIDEELTDFFGILSKRFYFNKGKYNLANKLIYDRAEDIVLYGKEILTRSVNYNKMFAKPYFHAERFEADFTLEECMSKLQQIEEVKRQK